MLVVRHGTGTPKVLWSWQVRLFGRGLGDQLTSCGLCDGDPVVRAVAVHHGDVAGAQTPVPSSAALAGRVSCYWRVRADARLRLPDAEPSGLRRRTVLWRAG